MKLRCARDRMLCALWIAGLMVLDALSKWWARTVLMPDPAYRVRAIPGLVDFAFVWNEGAAFSLFRARPQLVTVVSAVILLFVLITILLSKTMPARARYCASLVFAGGAGNLIDRLRFGAVADFIELTFIRFPVFNFADICVTVGAALFILQMCFPGAKGGRGA